MSGLSGPHQDLMSGCFTRSQAFWHDLFIGIPNSNPRCAVNTFYYSQKTYYLSHEKTEQIK